MAITLTLSGHFLKVPHQLSYILSCTLSPSYRLSKVLISDFSLLKVFGSKSKFLLRFSEYIYTTNVQGEMVL